MRKIKFLFLLMFSVFLLGNIDINASTNPQTDLVGIHVISYFDSENQVTADLTSLSFGSRVSLSAELDSLEGYSFVFWIVNGVVRTDLTIDAQFIITSEATIIGVFKPVGEVVAVFKDANGKLIDIQYLTPGSSATDIELLNLPSKPGYVFADPKWDHSLTNITVDTVFTLQYVPSSSASYSVTITNGSGSGTYDFNTQATISANAPAEGMYFAYWMEGNKVLSYESSYTFTVLSNRTIEAVYSTSAQVKTPLVNLSSQLALRDGYVSYLAQFELPSGYVLIEHGMIVSESSEVLFLSTVGSTTYKSNTYYELTNEYLMSFSNTSIQSARAYIIVEDANGNYLTIYNEIITEGSAAVYASDLFFSFYTEGSGYNKAVSIFNGTGSTVDLSQYSVKLYANGAATASSSMTLSGTLTSGSVYVIAHGSANATILAAADATNNGVINFNGDDAVTLEKTGVGIIDCIGQVGFDPGTSWSANGISTADLSLYRKTSTTSGDSNGSDAFDPSVGWTSDGFEIYTHIDTFTMDSTGSKTPVGFEAIFANPDVNIYGSLSFSGAYLKVYYDDGSASIEEVNISMVSNFTTNAAGDYTFTVTFSGLTDFIEYTVSKLIPTYTVPTFGDIELVNGMTLSDISLPSGFSWDNPSYSLSLGDYTVTVTYTPSDTNVYVVVNGIDVSLHMVEMVTPIVIFEIYGGGSNSGATYNQDYVVLYNNTSSSIDLSTYSLQYASTGAYSVINLSGTIVSHSYFIIGLYKGTVGSDLPITPQVTNSLNFSQSGARVALVDNQVAITDKTDLNIVDFVGYGSATEYETAAAPAMSAVLSIKRSTSSDSNDNSADFSASVPDLSYVVSSMTVTDFSIYNLKAYYEQNEALSVANAYLLVTYSNNATDTVVITSDMISSFTSSSLGDFQMLVTYSGVEKYYSYHVIDYSAIGEVEIDYIDIGQAGGPPGEAALIKIGGIEILIDSGDDDSASQTELLAYLATKVTDGTIEYIISTHPHADHIGGMIDVLNTYSVTNVIQYSTGSGYTSALKLNYEAAVASEGANVSYVYDIVTSAQTTLTIIPGVTLTFYNTGYLQSNDPNNSSIVFVVEAFNERALFNGDAEGDQEVVYASLVGDIDILKLGHHGSAVGTTSYLLNTTTPDYFIVNDGDYLGNTYGHPTYTAIKNIYNYSHITPIFSVTGGNGASSDIFLQRNGTITAKLSSTGIWITSEFYGYNPIELSATNYFSSINVDSIVGFYYQSATGITNATLLKAALHNLIDDHHSVGYDLVDENLGTTDEDPNNSSNVILFYTGRSQAKSTFGSTVDQWNREHIWAQSHGIDYAEPAYSDLHHLRPTDVSVNAARGNLDFGIVAHNSSTLVEDTYGDVLTYNYLDASYFEPRDEIKGDVARMMLYMTVRYEGDSGEPDLELVNGTTSTDSSNFGDLATLLQWSLADPVDASERARNEAIYGIQGNRNPFINQPWLIYILYATELGV